MQVKYTLDPAHMRPGEGRVFTKYLSQQSLHIDVWDGDSLLLIGSSHVDLKVQLLLFVSSACLDILCPSYLKCHYFSTLSNCAKFVNHIFICFSTYF